jgi:hypothetical protein
LEERPWGDFRRGKPISSAQLAKLLREFSIQSQSIRTDAGVHRGYYRTAFDDAFARYLATPTPSECYTATTLTQSGESPLFEVLHTPACSILENALNPAPDADCSTVALQNPQNDPEEVISLVD